MKLRLSLLASMLIAAGVASAADNAEKQYSSTIEQVKQIINHAQDEDFEVNLGVGVWETANAVGKETAMNEIGYLVKDISGDGVPELLIGLMYKKRDFESFCKGNEIFMIYTLENNKPLLVTEGWGRSMSCTMPGNQFFFTGSGGAAISLTGKYSLSYDGKSQSWSEFYYTYPDESSPNMDINFYRNKTGELDPDASEKIKFNYEEYEKIGESWSKMTAPWDEFKTLSQYGKSTAGLTAACSDTSDLKADFAPQDLSKLGTYNYIKVATSEPMVNVALSTKGKIADFKVLGLEFIEVDDQGNIKFKENTLYSANEINCNSPLVVSINFLGSIPNNGISYKDAKGNVKKFTISQSGEDGSLVLSEFK